MGKAQDVISCGKLIADLKGVKPKTLDQVLRGREFWQYALATDTLLKNKDNSNSVESTELELLSNFSELENYIDKSGNMIYSDLIKKFPDLIQSKKGKYGGTWMHLNLLLKLAAILDPDLEALIYDKFVTGQLLVHRDDSGESFKTLNIAIDNHLPTSAGIGLNRQTYIDAAITLRVACGLPQFIPKGVNVWNTMATDEQLKHRAACLDKIVLFLENDFVRDEEHLLGLIGKMKI